MIEQSLRLIKETLNRSIIARKIAINVDCCDYYRSFRGKTEHA